ncbi:hypothetical protein Zmor_024805 [Zophobas morio]|jgi:hypothetical protein|uniref:Uncharacterized protein n=1 Tax=Zophobas morio TaxID=2755281 RepID=A0AA38M1D3_9CUCU|nr:hypothetical protein Zmor_024805 [Zophobas morio]
MRICTLNLRTHCGSTGTSSETEQIAACSGAVVCEKLCTSPGHSAGPYKHCLPTPCRVLLRQAHQAHYGLLMSELIYEPWNRARYGHPRDALKHDYFLLM